MLVPSASACPQALALVPETFSFAWSQATTVTYSFNAYWHEDSRKLENAFYGLCYATLEKDDLIAKGLNPHKLTLEDVKHLATHKSKAYPEERLQRFAEMLATETIVIQVPSSLLWKPVKVKEAPCDIESLKSLAKEPHVVPAGTDGWYKLLRRKSR